MATIYQVGTGSFNSATWSLVSGVAGVLTPTSADDCIVDSGSGNFTINSGSVCRSLTINGYTGTITHTAGVNLAIGDGTAGAGNVALNVATTGWTYTLGSATTSSLTFISTSATQQTITPSTKTFGNITINGVGSSYILGSAHTAPSTTFTLTNGTFNTGNFNMSLLEWFGSNANVRTAIFGTSTITINSITSTGFSFNTATNLTFSGASSNIVIGSAITNDRTFAGGGLTYGTITYTLPTSSGRLIVVGANTVNTWNVSSGKTLRFTAGTTNTTTNFNVTGANYTANNGYVYMPGAAYGASVPDSAAVSITDDYDVRIRVGLDNWAATGAMRMAAKSLTTGNQRTWRLYHTAGLLTLDQSTDGAATSSANASANLSTVGVVNGSPIWIRFTREKATGNVKFYTAADNTSMPSSWTQLGTTQVATTASIFDSTALLTVGGEQIGTNSAPGKYYWFQVRNNILDDGTGIQADIKFTSKAWGADTFTEASSNAATVTMNGGSVVGDGRLVIESSSAGSAATLSKSSGTVSSDYMVIKDSTATGGASWYAGANSISVSGNTGWIFTAPPSTATGNFFMFF